MVSKEFFKGHHPVWAVKEAELLLRPNHLSSYEEGKFAASERQHKYPLRRHERLGSGEVGQTKVPSACVRTFSKRQTRNLHFGSVFEISNLKFEPEIRLRRGRSVL
jgi:hypothetical protein